MSNTVTLNGTETPLDSENGRAFVTDVTRAAEGLLADAELAQIYELSPADFQNLTKDAALIRAIRIERDRRVKSGLAAREAAQKHFVRAPNVLAAIMDSEQSNARHKVESIRELRAISTPEQNNPAMDQTRFIIQINMGSDVEVYDKPFAIGIDDDTPREPPIQSNVLPLQAEKRKRGRPRKVTNDRISDNE